MAEDVDRQDVEHSDPAGMEPFPPNVGKPRSKLAIFILCAVVVLLAVGIFAGVHTLAFQPTPRLRVLRLRLLCGRYG